jgi:hypothetical protein
MSMVIRRTALLLPLWILTAAPLAAHGFHGEAHGALSHVAVHALPLAALGAAVFLVARFTPVVRVRGARWLQAAGAALVLLAAVSPLV